MKKTYEVTILDQKFMLKTENNEDHVKRVTDYVNKVMHAIKMRSSTISTQNVAILGALNIAEDMYAKTDETKEIIADWKDRLNDLIDLKQ
ncbi:MAG: cell division protein ZapA [bacterium]|nr:cell division protein ZapA [bacterium]MBU1919043.1 cell division protein ZapA [bacterium]